MSIEVYCAQSAAIAMTPACKQQWVNNRSSIYFINGHAEWGKFKPHHTGPNWLNGQMLVICCATAEHAISKWALSPTMNRRIAMWIRKGKIAIIICAVHLDLFSITYPTAACVASSWNHSLPHRAHIVVRRLRERLETHMAVTVMVIADWWNMVPVLLLGTRALDGLTGVCRLSVASLTNVVITPMNKPV